MLNLTDICLCSLVAILLLIEFGYCNTSLASVESCLDIPSYAHAPESGNSQTTIPRYVHRTSLKGVSVLTLPSFKTAFFPDRVGYPAILATCVFAIALSFPMLPIFPLIGLPAVVFLILLFAASRYLATFTDCSLLGSSGGKLVIWLLRSLALVLLCQPVLLGLILLSRREWGIGGASIGVAVVGLLLFEGLVWKQGRTATLSRTEHAKFRLFAKRLQSHAVEPIDNMSIDRPSDFENSGRRRRSNATIFELMSDLLLPSNQTRSQGHLPLKTENIDAYLDPYRANLAHPDINQNQHELPPLSLRENENLDMAKYQAENTMYPPGLIMPAPVIWLPDDKTDVGKQEVEDLRRFHRLSAMLDAVRS